MPLFGGNKRPPLDGLTQDEEKRRAGLNDALTKRTEGKEGEARNSAIVEVISEQSGANSNEFLWPLLMGWQQMSMHRYVAAIDSFAEAARRDNKEVRCLSGKGSAYMKAGQSAQSGGTRITAEMAPPGKSARELYGEAHRCFQAALILTKDKGELEVLHRAETEAATAITRS